MSNILAIIITTFIIFCFIVFAYLYNSGSCHIEKEYICSKKFCLIKEFSFQLPAAVLAEINTLLRNKCIQKRVNISSYVETIGNCALPNKAGVTIPTKQIMEHSKSIIPFYQVDLRKTITDLLGFKIHPTELKYQTSCAVLIYEEEGDWINWHYDHNYYDGRFFTVLIPITKELTCTKFQFKNEDNKIISLDLNNNAVCFEGNFVYHRASKLCANQRRAILSCQFVTSNCMSFINQLRIKLKDFAYLGSFT